MVLKPKQTALALGTFAALMHAIWALFVLAGVAQPLMSWLFSLHFISIQYTVTAFNWMTAITLVIVTFIIGSIIGWIFANAWNWVAGRKW